jgi:hypothetical protein
MILATKPHKHLCRKKPKYDSRVTAFERNSALLESGRGALTLEAIPDLYVKTKARLTRDAVGVIVTWYPSVT